MKNKSYYLDLADRRFEALLTEDEELELKSFLASTEDPDFDEVKAVAGFFAALITEDDYGQGAGSCRGRSGRRA